MQNATKKPISKPAAAARASRRRRRGDSAQTAPPAGLATPLKRALARFKNRPDTEVEQNVIRVVYTAVVLVYAVLYGRWFSADTAEVARLAAGYIVFSLGIFLWIYLAPGKSMRRIVLHMLGDRAIITWILLWHGAWIAPAYIFYLWVDVGSPARYGRAFLLPPMLVSLTGFTLVLLMNPYWQTLGPIAYGLWVALLMLPLFTWQFFRRLNEVNQRLVDQATHDALTRLPNRVFFYNQLSAAIAGAERHKRDLAVLFIDLDNFKRINDTQGHDAGDDALRDAAGALQQCVRQGDCVARLGGDEFVVLLHDVHDAELRHIGDSLCEQLGMYTRNHLSASVGVAAYPVCGTDAETLVQHADHAMYAAKKAGKARCIACADVNKMSSE